MLFLELSLSQWRQIAYESRSAELRDYIRRFIGVSGHETLVLHPVDRDHDTDKQQAVHVSEERSLELTYGDV